VARAFAAAGPQAREAYMAKLNEMWLSLPAVARAEVIANAKRLQGGSIDPRIPAGLGNDLLQFGLPALGAVLPGLTGAGAAAGAAAGTGGWGTAFNNLAGSLLNTYAQVNAPKPAAPAATQPTVYAQERSQPQVQPQVVYVPQQTAPASKPTDWTNIALIGGGVVGVGVLVFLIAKKKKGK